MANAPRNLAASARQRLLNLSRSVGASYNHLLIRFAIERLLYRLSISGHRDAFILKGAMLFSVWEGSPHRATVDLDLLGFGERPVERMSAVFRELCSTPFQEDGWAFDPKSVEAEEIRTIDEYAGVRVRLIGKLGSAIVRVQTDVGFGDAVTPAAQIALFPTLLSMPSPSLRVYPRETVVAEKLEAIVKLGLFNTRHKDYYDLRYLARHFDFDGGLLAQALRATFDRRGTRLPTEVPAGLTGEFSQDAAKQRQWSAFIQRLGETDCPLLPQIDDEVASFVALPLRAASASAPLVARWRPSGPWEMSST